jgi:ribonuclease HII
MVRSTKPAPTLILERAMLAEGVVTVAGVDEVGRGCVAGDVACGLVVVDATAGPIPVGLADSKLLSSTQRVALVPLIKAWALDWGVGMASALEIDTYGLSTALRLAGHRALAQLRVAPGVVLLDGKFDWLSKPAQVGLFDPVYADVGVPEVRTKVKADLSCASVAAASVLAKVERDHLMVQLSERYPEYGWAENKGYATAAHFAALGEYGACDEHRRTWNLGTTLVRAPGAATTTSIC